MQLKLPHEVKSEETKKKILDAVEGMLAQYDFKYLTVRNICDEAGVAYGSFYHHFGSKENVLYQYVCKVFQEVMAQNPLPEWIHPDDYIKTCLWFIKVYGLFCDSLGKDLVKFLCTNCRDEIFTETFDAEIRPRIEKAADDGYLDVQRDRIESNRKRTSVLCKDLIITYHGVVLWWSNSSSDNTEPVYDTLEHLCFNMLYSFCSEKYDHEDFPHMLLGEYSQFMQSVVMDTIFTRKKQ